MLPTRSQFNKWALPTKWGFIAALIGIPLSITSLFVTMRPHSDPGIVQTETHRWLFQAAMELRYNHEWLTEVSRRVDRGDKSWLAGSVKTEGLAKLVEHEYDFVTQDAYGEQKNIYGQVLLLRDNGNALASALGDGDIATFNRRNALTLHDITFLNGFLLWYLAPRMGESLSEGQLYSLGRHWYPGETFQLRGVRKLKMKFFQHQGVPIRHYLDYLGLLD